MNRAQGESFAVSKPFATYPANLCPFRGGGAASSSRPRRTILPNESGNSKRFCDNRLPASGTPAKWGFSCHSQVRQLERKEELKAYPPGDGRFVKRRTSVKDWPVFCDQRGSIGQKAGIGTPAGPKSKMATYTSGVIHENPEGGFWAEVPALPGCYSQGETGDELKHNIREAIAGVLEVLREQGREPDSNIQILDVAV